LPPLGKHLLVSDAVLVERISGGLFAKIFMDYPTLKYLFSYFRNLCVHVFGSLPHSIYSDQGPQFSSCVWSNLLSPSKVKCKLTSGHCHEGNGLAKRMIQNFVQTLRVYCLFGKVSDYNSLVGDSLLSFN
jgi:hypothetical protein